MFDGCVLVVFALNATGKVARYLRFLLKDLGYEQSGPTPIYIDNLPALQMINDNSSPIDRTRHVHIRYFSAILASRW